MAIGQGSGYPDRGAAGGRAVPQCSASGARDASKNRAGAPASPDAEQAYRLKRSPEVDAADVFVCHHFLRAAFHQYLAVVHDVGAVDDFQRLAHVMVGDQHADAAVLEMADQVADFAHRDRVDAGQRLVEQDVAGLGGQRPGDLHPAPLAAGQRQRGRAAEMADAEFGQQFVEHLVAPVGVGLDHLQRRHDVLFDIQAAEHAGFLRQVADAEAGAAVHRQQGDVVPVQADRAGVRADQADDHVEGRGLAGAVRAEQPDRLAAPDGDGDVPHHRALACRSCRPRWRTVRTRPGSAPGGRRPREASIMAAALAARPAWHRRVWRRPWPAPRLAFRWA